MFVRVKSTPNSPRKTVQIVESIRDGNKVKQKIVRYVGVAMNDDELVKLKEVAEYVKANIEAEHQASLFNPEQVAQQVIESKSQSESNKPLRVDLKQLREQQRVTVGIHEIYGQLFDELGFGSSIGHPSHNVSAVDIFRHIVLARIANPVSKRETVTSLEQDFGISIPLEKVYRMMDKLDDKAINRIKDTVLSGTRQLVGHAVDVLFFDCTTLYFESFTEDELKSNGYSKDMKFNQPQVLLALLVTQDGLPVGYEVYPGNTFEGHRLQAAIADLHLHYDIERIVFVADRGLLSQNNLTHLEAQEIPYIVGAKLKTLPQQEQRAILKQVGYLKQGNDDEPRSYEFTYQGRRWIVEYNHARAEKDRKDREQSIERITKKLKRSKNPKSLLSNFGYKKYLKMAGDTHISVDQSKIERDSQWDGLKGVVTSLDTMSAQGVFGHYKGLWQVEDSFRITKHDLKVRPIYHWTPKRIQAHLAISFVAFSLVRFLSYRVKLQHRKLSPAVIRNALLHVQRSLLVHIKTKVLYCIPSNVNPEASKIYQVMGRKLSTTPFQLT